MFRVVCIEEKLVDIAYFLNDMDYFELNMICTNLNYADKQNWERTRLIGYIIAQCNSTKKLDATDILKFPWDKTTEEAIKIDTKEEIEALKNKADEMLALLNNTI